MAIQQVGAAQAASDIPVFYVPGPSQGVNAFAAFTTNFLQQRNVWALEVFRARLRALDPTARAQLVLAAAKQQTDLEKARINELNVKRQSQQSLLKTLLDFDAKISDIEAKRDISRFEGQVKQNIAATSLTSDQAKGLSQRAAQALRAAGESRAAGDDAAFARNMNVVRGIVGPGGEAESVLSNLEQNALRGQVAGGIRQQFDQLDQGPVSQDLIPQGVLEVDVPGLGGVGATASRGLALAEQLGIDTSELAAPGTAFQLRTRAPARAQPPPTGAEPTTEVGPDVGATAAELQAQGVPPFAARRQAEAQALAAEEVPELGAVDIRQQPGALPPSGGEDLVSRIERITREGQSELGAIGDPIFRREDPRIDIIDRFLQRATPSQEVDFLQGAAAAGERPGLFPGRQLERESLAAREQIAQAEAEAAPDIVTTTRGAEEAPPEAAPPVQLTREERAADIERRIGEGEDISPEDIAFQQRQERREEDGGVLQFLRPRRRERLLERAMPVEPVEGGSPETRRVSRAAAKLPARDDPTIPSALRARLTDEELEQFRRERDARQATTRAPPLAARAADGT